MFYGTFPSDGLHICKSKQLLQHLLSQTYVTQIFIPYNRNVGALRSHMLVPQRHERVPHRKEPHERYRATYRLHAYWITTIPNSVLTIGARVCSNSAKLLRELTLSSSSGCKC